MTENGYLASLEMRPESMIARAAAHYPAGIPTALRDLLGTLDLWCDLSATLGHHLRDGAHALVPGRYGLLVWLGGPAGSPVVLGPLCGECEITVFRVAREWATHWRGASAEVAPWCEAVRRAGR